jgi:curli biogenesis system outer membrane secretion channel CsgG
LAEFATEVVNQSVRNGGISTVAWFKVEKQVKTLLGGQQSFGYAGGGSSLTSDANMNEVISAGKKLGARYILRSVILKQSENSQAESKFSPSIGMLFGIGGPGVKTEIKSDAEVDVKVDIISTAEEDIIASKTFSGRSREVTKERANRLDGITGMQVFSSGSSMDSTKVAFYDTIDKIVDFLQNKTQ